MARILIVDDHPASLELVHAVLENAGYEVMEARDGAEAVLERLPPSDSLFFSSGWRRM